MQSNSKVKEFYSKIKGAHVAVMGVGISNRPLIRYIYKLGAKITAFDALPEDDPVLSKTKSDFEGEGIHLHWSCGESYLSALEKNEYTYIFRTPKMRFDVPELQKAVEKGSVLTSELQLFMELCPAKIFGITGSDGKTTTTTLVSLFLQEAGYRVFLGGNIGFPLLDQIEKVGEDDMVVLELSSFQLSTMKKSADISVVTNVTPNHLDVHKDYQEYIDAKKNIFVNQGYDGRLVLNLDNEITKGMSGERRGQLCYFSRKGAPSTVLPLVDYVFCDDDSIYTMVNGEKKKAFSTKDILLLGDHNIENYMAAMACALPYVSVEKMQKVAKTFPGVEHRIELVRTLKGVRYYNSSIDTSPNRTIHTMNALQKRGDKGVLIAGGADKKCDYTGLGEAILAVCDRIILCGSNAPFIIKALEDEGSEISYQLFEEESFEEAVLRSQEIAKEGEIVILSPVGTSYDRFRHFEERGNLFKKLIQELS